MAEKILESIAQYVCDPPQFSDEAYLTARLCLADALGCAILALQYPACIKMLGPIVPEMTMPNGCRIPGTSFVMDPVNAAFTLGSMIRWLDFNDTWLAAEWGHPSDNIGGLLPICDYLSRQRLQQGGNGLLMQDLLKALIQAYEIQGCLALANSFNRIGLDHVILVKVATAAVSARILGGSYEQVMDALSQAWLDLGPLRAYRHAPNVCSRKSWAAGDATARGVWLSLMTMRGERSCPLPLTAEKWGLYDVLLQGKPFSLPRPLGCYVMENILFKVAFPAEFHAQTAVEAAFQLHALISGRLDAIQSIEITTHEAALRIIDKKGPLHNPADRDHCLQYMVAVGLLNGKLAADDYEDEAAKDPRIDRLRQKMVVKEDLGFSQDYMHPEKRSIANAVQIFFTDGSRSERIAIAYPLGHRRRRQEALPLLAGKLQANLHAHYNPQQAGDILAVFDKQEELLQMPISDFVDTWINP